MMDAINLIWIMPLCFIGGFMLAALLCANGRDD